MFPQLLKRGSTTFYTIYNSNFWFVVDEIILECTSCQGLRRLLLSWE